jgi:predicted RNA-binding protein with PUA-like domain
MACWLVKQEPESYSFDQFQREKETAWTGVRNFQARNNLKAMAKGDRVFYYHSGEQKAVVGLAHVVKPAYPDPTATEGSWVSVDLRADKPLPRPVLLSEIKTSAQLKNMVLARNSRLSVSPVTDAEEAALLKLGSAAKSA